jgi:hypothetical protein
MAIEPTGSADPVTAGAELRAESDTFVAQLERLAELEFAKRELSPSDPRFIALALQVEDAAKALLDDARGQSALADQAHVDHVTTPITEIPADLSAHQVISAWRDLERQLEGMDPASDEAATARLMIDAYRRAYRRLYAERTSAPEA